MNRLIKYQNFMLVPVSFLDKYYCKPTNYFTRFKLAGFAVSVHPGKFIAAKMSDVMKTRKFFAPE